MARSQYVFNALDFAKAEADGKRLKIVADCPNSEWNGSTILECLDCGVSNPYVSEYPTQSELAEAGVEDALGSYINPM